MRAMISMLLAMIALTTSTAFAAVEVPELKGRVNDYAGILSPKETSNLEHLLKTEEDETSNQIVILIIESFNGEDDAEYANTVFGNWKLGQADKDNGVLIVQSTQDRRIQIEVGYGLEGSLTDLLTAQIIRKEMTPLFKDGKYYDGYLAGIESIRKAIKGEYAAEDAKSKFNATSLLIAIALMGATLILSYPIPNEYLHFAILLGVAICGFGSMLNEGLSSLIMSIMGGVIPVFAKLDLRSGGGGYSGGFGASTNSGNKVLDVFTGGGGNSGGGGAGGDY